MSDRAALPGTVIGTARVVYMGRGKPQPYPIDPDEPVERLAAAEARLAEQAALVEAAVALVAAEVAEHAATDDMEAACRVEDQAMTYDEWRPARDRLNAAVAGLEAVRATRKVKQEGLLVEARAYAARQAGPGGDPADGGSGEGQGGE